MKIFISAESNLKESLMDPRFGRCQFFQIYDTETDEIKSIVNDGFNSKSGAGIQAGNLLLDQKADVLITGHLGPNAKAVLKESNIKIFTSIPKKISEIIKNYKNNELKEVKD